MTNSGECRDRGGILEEFGYAAKTCLVCRKAGKNHCLNVEQPLAREHYRGDSTVEG